MDIPSGGAETSHCDKFDAGAGDTQCYLVPQGHLSRLLYCNPVCFLVASKKKTADSGNDEEQSAAKVEDAAASIDANPSIMTISWLTPINNSGMFFCSVNKKRFTASCLHEGVQFSLNIATEAHAALLRQVGACSSSSLPSKVEHLGIDLCQAGWGKTPIHGNEEHVAKSASVDCEHSKKRAKVESHGGKSSQARPSKSQRKLLRKQDAAQSIAGSLPCVRTVRLRPSWLLRFALLRHTCLTALLLP